MAVGLPLSVISNCSAGIAPEAPGRGACPDLVLSKGQDALGLPGKEDEEEAHPGMKAIAQQQRAPGIVEGLPKSDTELTGVLHVRSNMA